MSGEQERKGSVFIIRPLLIALGVYGSMWISFLVLGSLWLAAHFLELPKPDISLTNVLIGSVLVGIVLTFLALGESQTRLEEELRKLNEQLKAPDEEVEREA